MAATEEINDNLDQETFGDRSCENSSPIGEKDNQCNLCRYFKHFQIFHKFVVLFD